MKKLFSVAALIIAMTFSDSTATSQSPVTAPVPTYQLDRAAVAGNIAQYAFGVNIYDGAAHPISGETTNPIWSNVHTLQDLANITTLDGKIKPFFFATDNGGITGNMCTNDSNVNCFLNSADPTGYYKLTDASVPNLDIRWLAMQAAALQRELYWSQPISVPMPVMIPITTDDSYASMNITSYGKEACLYPTTDFGAGYAVLTVGDPAATPANHLGRFGANGVVAGTWTNVAVCTPQGHGTSYMNTGYQMNGMNLATHWFHATMLYATGFKHGIALNGDHAQLDSVYLPINWEGLYWDFPSPGLAGNITFEDLRSESYFAAEAINNAAFASYVVHGNQYLAGPIEFFCEKGSTNAPCISGITAQTTQTEATKLAVFQEETGFPSGIPGVGSTSSTYSPLANVRSVNGVHFGVWLLIFQSDQDAPISSNTPNYKRRSMAEVGAVNNFTASIESTNQQSTPNVPNGTINADGGGFFVVNNMAQVELSGDPQDMISKLNNFAGNYGVTSPVPIINPMLTNGYQHNFTLHETGTWDGAVYPARSNPGTNYTQAHIGDCFEYVADALPCGTTFAFGPLVAQFLGEGLQPLAIPTDGSSIVYMPMISRGLLTGIKGDSNLFQIPAAFRTSTGQGAIRSTPGSNGTPGTYTIASQGGGCAQQEIVLVTIGANGMLASLQKTQSAYGCTQAVSYDTSSIPNWTGSLTATFPSGLVENAILPGGGAFVGAYGGQQSVPTPTNGTYVYNVVTP